MFIDPARPGSITEKIASPISIFKGDYMRSRYPDSCFIPGVCIQLLFSLILFRSSPNNSQHQCLSARVDEDTDVQQLLSNVYMWIEAVTLNVIKIVWGAKIHCLGNFVLKAWNNVIFPVNGSNIFYCYDLDLCYSGRKISLSGTSRDLSCLCSAPWYSPLVCCWIIGLIIFTGPSESKLYIIFYSVRRFVRLFAAGTPQERRHWSHSKLWAFYCSTSEKYWPWQFLKTTKIVEISTLKKIFIVLEIVWQRRPSAKPDMRHGRARESRIKQCAKAPKSQSLSWQF